MATNEPPEDSRAELANDTLPERRPPLLWTLAPFLLVAGTILQVVAMNLPWEHLDFVEYHQGMDIVVTTFITKTTQDDVVGGAFFPTIGSFPIYIYPTSGQVFWQSALVFIGLLLVLAFFLAQRPVLRWTFAVLYGLWLLYSTALALSFVATAHAVNTGRYVVTSQPTWWEQLVRIDVELSGRSDPLSPAWGYWLYIGALVVSWLALGLAISVLTRGRDRSAIRARGDQSAPRRRAWLATTLVTVGAVIWVTSLAALPMLVTDCSRPLRPLTPLLARICRSEAVLYPLQASAHGVIVSAFPATFNTAATFDLAGNEFLRMVAYFLDFGLLVLAMAAVPLVLVAVWRARVTRGVAVWLSIWAALVLFETSFLLHVLTTLLSPLFAGRVFTPSIGPGAFLVPLGSLLIAAGVVWYLL
jgi:hypothetical protein